MPKAFSEGVLRTFGTVAKSASYVLTGIYAMFFTCNLQHKK